MPANEKSSIAAADVDLPAPVLARIVERLGPLAIWLFGARTTRRTRPGSDYDLLAVMPDGAPEDKLDPVKAWAVTRDLGVPLDLIPCTLASSKRRKTRLEFRPTSACVLPLWAGFSSKSAAARRILRPDVPRPILALQTCVEWFEHDKLLSKWLCGASVLVKLVLLGLECGQCTVVPPTGPIRLQRAFR